MVKEEKLSLQTNFRLQPPDNEELIKIIKHKMKYYYIVLCVTFTPSYRKYLKLV